MKINNILTISHHLVRMIRDSHTFSTRESQYHLLRIIFYAYLSNKQTLYLKENKVTFNNISESKLQAKVKDHIGYLILPLKYLINEAAHSNLNNETLNSTFTYFNRSATSIYQNIFKSTNKYNIKQLRSLSYLIFSVYNLSTQLDLNEYYGSLFVYILKNYMLNQGKRNNFSYTPIYLSNLMAQIIISNNKPSSVYDPTMGTGTSLLCVKSQDSKKDITMCGQELNAETYTLAKMNLLIHNVSSDNINITNANTLSHIWPKPSLNKYDAVISVPPYSEHWAGNSKNVLDLRFLNYGFAPKSKADYAFLLDGLYHLSISGTMAILLPLGILFRGSKEAKIRKHLILNNNIDAIIGLPSKLLYNSPIPTVLLILKKKRSTTDVVFINATKEFTKQGHQRVLRHQNINKITNAYNHAEDNNDNRKIHIASLKEIQDNNYNLNIPRYIDMSHPKPIINIKDTQSKLNKINKEINKSTTKLKEIENKFNIKD